MPANFYPGQNDYIDKLNTLATSTELVDILTVSQQYLGNKATNPTVDNEGLALLIGATYWNTAVPEMRVWSGTAWFAVQSTSAATAAAASATAASTSATNSANSATTASTQATNAAGSATTASTQATNAAGSATTASTQATNASNSATAAANSASTASTQATNAANSATAAAGSATTASTQATNASNSATAAAGSATTASTQATNAAGSATTASTQATNAATSATEAAGSASSASSSLASVNLIFDTFDDRFLGSKTVAPTLDNDGFALVAGTVYYNSVTKEVNFYNGVAWEAPAASATASATAAANSASTASTQATNASNSATAASTSESNAASSATTASTQATNASNSATAAAGSATTASTQATGASNSATSASGSATTASTQATNASNSATAAAGSATTASTQATNASNSATAAANSATTASTQATNAAGSASAAAASYDSFDDRYLGANASEPTLDNDGNALLTGALYFNSTTATMRVWSGAAWKDASGGSAITTTLFSGTGAQVAFVLPSAPLSKSNTQVYINGVYQNKDTYSLASATVTFSEAPLLGTNNIEVVQFSSVEIANAPASYIEYTPTGGIAATDVQAAITELDTEKANLASPTFTGTPAAPTAVAATNTTQLATTAHVFAERTNTATLTNKTLTSPVINAINGTPIGGTTASAGAFTTLSASGSVVLTGSATGINSGVTGGILRISGGTPDNGAIIVLGGATHPSIPNKGAFRIGGTEIAAFSSTGLAVTGVLSSNTTGSSIGAKVQTNQSEAYTSYLANGGLDGYVRVGASDNNLVFVAGNTEKARIDSGGHLGLGVAPSAWDTALKAAQISYGAVSANTSQVRLTHNFYFNGSERYIATGYATMYRQDSGAHMWSTAPSGVAGNPITFTQRMLLDSTGLTVTGTLSANGTISAQNTTGYGSSANMDVVIGGTDNGFVDNGNVSHWRQFVSGNASGQSYKIQGFVRGTGYADRVTVTNTGLAVTGALSVTNNEWGTVNLQGSYGFGADNYNIRLSNNGTIKGYIGQAPAAGGICISAGMRYYGGGPWATDSTTASSVQQSGGNIIFTTDSGLTGGVNFTPSERMRLDVSGNLMIGTTSLVNYSKVSVQGAYGVAVKGVDNASEIFSGISAAGGTVYVVYGSGSVLNNTGVYGSLSDLKLKENIVDTTPKLAKLLQVRIVNYNLKTDPLHRQIGVIAQELELISPGLIDTTPDYAEVSKTREVEVPAIDAVLDEEGNEVTPAVAATTKTEEYTEREATGEVTKSVKYSVFVPMLIKAMQEQQEMIVAMQARITALESKE